jgi:hypothetical protein
MDTALNAGSSEGALPLINTTGKGVWTISPPLANDAHLAGVPAVTLNVSSLLPNANLSVDLYDIDAKNSALLLSRNAYLLPSGNSQISPEMYGNDWLIPAGHRLGVLVTTANAEWWTPLPSLSNVTVNSGSITTFRASARRASTRGSARRRSRSTARPSRNRRARGSRCRRRRLPIHSHSRSCETMEMPSSRSAGPRTLGWGAAVPSAGLPDSAQTCDCSGTGASCFVAVIGPSVPVPSATRPTVAGSKRIRQGAEPE